MFSISHHKTNTNHETGNFTMCDLASLQSKAQAYGQNLDYDPNTGLFTYWYNVNTNATYKKEYGGDSTIDQTKYATLSALDSNHVGGRRDYIVLAAMNGAVYPFPFDSIGSKMLSPTPTALSSGSRSFNTSYRISTTNNSEISVSVQVALTLLLTSGQVFLEYSPNNSTWYFGAQIPASLVGIYSTGGQLSCKLPKGYYWRLRTTGAGTFTFLGGTEYLY